MRLPPFTFISALVLLCSFANTRAQVVINEIHYHPVEEAAFDINGNPIVDLTEDVHEFIELRNVGAAAVDLGGWQLDDGVSFTMPAGTSIAAGGYKVVAKNPARLQTVYGISGVLGPYSGVLSNSGDTIKLKDAGGTVVDSVGYSASFPWAIAADGLGAGSAFQGSSLYPYQYKGRSLQRVSPTALSNDPANWLASPLSPGPTPGSANAVTRVVPKPVVVSLLAAQASDESQTIRASEPVKVDAYFSGTTALSSVQVEWFVDDIESTSETRTTIAMNDLGNGHWATSAPIPGQVESFGRPLADSGGIAGTGSKRCRRARTIHKSRRSEPAARGRRGTATSSSQSGPHLSRSTTSSSPRRMSRSSIPTSPRARAA
jgi:hypothetical protein